MIGRGLGIPNKQTPYLLRKALLAGDKCDRRMCIVKRCVTLLREIIKDTIILMDRAAVGFNKAVFSMQSDPCITERMK